MKLEKERAMEALGIPEDMYMELVNCFVSETAGALCTLKETVNLRDFENIANNAHFIKGSAGNLRLEEIYAAAKEIELEAKTGKEIQIIEGALAKLVLSFDELKKIAG
ncbi:MAG: Hpt domain-containing protein [Candidatus Omnitrophica bacterium]|nr:Hpt domain-containing protein [Candidatus Omnitrophota bacterium]